MKVHTKEKGHRSKTAQLAKGEEAFQQKFQKGRCHFMLDWATKISTQSQYHDDNRQPFSGTNNLCAGKPQRQPASRDLDYILITKNKFHFKNITARKIKTRTLTQKQHTWVVLDSTQQPSSTPNNLKTGPDHLTVSYQPAYQQPGPCAVGRGCYGGDEIFYCTHSNVFIQF